MQSGAFDSCAEEQQMHRDFNAAIGAAEIEEDPKGSSQTNPQ